jgi:hypothetical protein
MAKIKVAMHSKTLGYAGTDRTAQLMCKYLAQSDDFEPFLLYRENDDVSRYGEVSKFLDAEHLISYKLKHKPKAPPPYWPESHNLDAILTSIKPDIFHIHRSGYTEFPGFKSLVPKGTKIVETNIFGNADPTGEVDLNIYISNFIRDSALSKGNPFGPVLYNP